MSPRKAEGAFTGPLVLRKGKIMLRDWKDFWIYWQLYKKGKYKMEKVKEFVKKYKKQLLIGTGAVFIYGIGFKCGYNSALGGIDHFIDKTLNTLDIKKF